MLRGLFKKIGEMLSGGGIDEEFYEALVDLMIQGDVGVETADKLVENLRQRVEQDRVRDPEVVQGYLRDAIVELLERNLKPLQFHPEPPTVMLIVGVNGTGKTTTIAKFAYRFKQEGRRVMLAAGDTFRAAAIDQLQVWADRVGVDLVRQQEGSDPSAVVFDAVQAAKSRGYDVVIADTAGRLHTKRNLMEEVRKTSRAVQRVLNRPPDETLLVLDATTGQNAVRQAQMFHQALGVTGIVLAKMDGTAKGGVVITLADELNLPIKFMGIGERPRDLVDFQPRAFVQELFES